MRKKILPAVLLGLSLALTGCAAAPDSTVSVSSAAEALSITDSLGITAALPENPRVVALYGSYAASWQLSGGTVVGVTQDAVEEHGIEIDDDTALVGTVKEPNLELIASLSPDYVLLSADLSAHLELDGALSDMRIPHGYFRMDTFDDYDSVMRSFCTVNGTLSSLYNKNVTAVRERINGVVSEARDALAADAPRVLLLRAFSTGVKAKTNDNLAGILLDDLGAYNIAYDAPSLLEDLSVEEIVRQNPDFIFILTMGDEDAAKAYMQEQLEASPAWGGLTAVRDGRCIYLPKELFHYKPLNRWDESYAYLAETLLGKTE